MAQSLAITPKRGKDHKAPKQDGERHEKVSSLEFSVFSRFGRASLGEPVWELPALLAGLRKYV